jgi:hypothetical protein
LVFFTDFGQSSQFFLSSRYFLSCIFFFHTKATEKLGFLFFSLVCYFSGGNSEQCCAKRYQKILQSGKDGIRGDGGEWWATCGGWHLLAHCVAGISHNLPVKLTHAKYLNKTRAYNVHI